MPCKTNKGGIDLQTNLPKQCVRQNEYRILGVEIEY